MGLKYLIDSNAAIDYLKGSLSDSGMNFMNDVVNDIPKVSIITEIEVLGFNTTPDSYKLLTDFFEDALTLPLSEEVAQKTIELRKAYKIKLPDAIIAATALVHGLSLITNNERDFKNIADLKVANPHRV